MCLMPRLEIVRPGKFLASARDEVILPVHVVRCDCDEPLSHQPRPRLHEPQRYLATRDHLHEVEAVRRTIRSAHRLEQMHPEILRRFWATPRPMPKSRGSGATNSSSDC